MPAAKRAVPGEVAADPQQPINDFDAEVPAPGPLNAVAGSDDTGLLAAMAERLELLMERVEALEQARLVVQPQQQRSPVPAMSAEEAQREANKQGRSVLSRDGWVMPRQAGQTPRTMA